LKLGSGVLSTNNTPTLIGMLQIDVFFGIGVDGTKIPNSMSILIKMPLVALKTMKSLNQSAWFKFDA
jgi:hypothetical protein